MTLEAQLAGMREASAKRIPPEKRAIMKQATEDQRESGILNHTIKIGGSLPDFSLNNANGVEVHSGDLLSQGPVGLTVFRGVW